VCREVNANGGRRKYRALVADRAASRRALRPKRAKLAQCRRLRGMVERKLEAKWSPQQISAWLALEHPDRPEMQVRLPRNSGHVVYAACCLRADVNS
jgi:IS30 family transposase